MNALVNGLVRTFALILLPSVLLLDAPTSSAQGAKGSYVTTADVQVRRGPGTNHEVVATIPKGIKIDVVGREGHWLKIESKHGKQPGYIDEQFARPADTQPAAQSKTAPASVAGTYRTVVDVDLREGPGPQHRIMQKLPAGIIVHVTRAEGDWLRIESKRGNRPGYVEKRVVERWTDK
jgi:N-acetylmuramoyl-L-alanine amidase